MKDLRTVEPKEPPETDRVSPAAPGQPAARWLLLIHQIPPQPSYFRVKIWRRLQALGAVTVKNSVYALPASEESHEDLQWILREIQAGGGEGLICEARLVDGLSDGETIQMFRSARDADYAEVAAEARSLLDQLATDAAIAPERRRPVETQAARLGRRLAEIAKIDFFGAAGRETAAGLLDGIAERLAPPGPPPPGPQTATAPVSAAAYAGRVWVTRTGLHIDRIASAWLIRRFIDPDARFKFVADRNYRPAPGELRFDMFEAEFTHEGELCTFEVLIRRLGLDDAALAPIAEIIHDIDLKDAKYAREETVGIDRLIAGIALQHRGDDERLNRGADVFDGLYEYFRRKRRPQTPAPQTPEGS
jgi:hypothetical protein